ncbi:DUF7455 domain-containing protein [Trueperella pyogenes]
MRSWAHCRTRVLAARERLRNKRNRPSGLCFDQCVNTVLETPILTAADRCDACSAQAYVRVELASGQLFFCGHHARERMPALEKVAISIIDETDHVQK